MEKYPPLHGMSDQKRIEIVKEIFSSITAKYDFLNRFLSLRRDVVWRRAAVKRMHFFHTHRMLDVATGTADLAIEAATHHRNVYVIGLDFVQEMIDTGQVKVNRKNLSSRITLMNGDALELPFPENYFDVAGIAFGIRNIPDREKTLQEMKRTVVPGGQVMILELTLPQNRKFQRVYRIYLYRILQRLARVLSNNPSSYFYLVDSITQFLTPDQCLKLMGESGLIRVESIPLTFGITHLYIGYKPNGKTAEKDKC